MSPWLLAVILLVPPLVVPLAVAMRADLAGRLVAVQLGTNVTVLALVLSSFAFDQPSFIDLPLTLAVLSLPSTLVFAIFIERWL